MKQPSLLRAHSKRLIDNLTSVSEDMAGKQRATSEATRHQRRWQPHGSGSDSSPVPEGTGVASIWPSDFIVVGIGASAGGLEAFTKLLNTLPGGLGLALVLIQHLEPTHNSMLVDLLTDHTSMRVIQAADGMPVERDYVYAIPPRAFLSIRDGVFRLSAPR
jgi:chemotaxis response regulator CheB